MTLEAGQLAMEGMTRDRRVYHALETEDSQAYSRLLKERKESRAQYGRVAEARDSLLSYFPGLSCLCADTGLAAALEDVEEKYCALQQRSKPQFLPSRSCLHPSLSFSIGKQCWLHTWPLPHEMRFT